MTGHTVHSPPPAVVDIADVVPTVIKVKAADLRAGDKVFDVYGGQHKLVSVKHLQAKHLHGMVSIKREDQKHREWYRAYEEFTIIRDMPKAPADPTVVEHGDALPPGSRNPYDAATGEWIARCKCGEEFRDASEPFAADAKMMDHAEAASR